jgi:hypothetical protein
MRKVRHKERGLETGSATVPQFYLQHFRCSVAKVRFLSAVFDPSAVKSLASWRPTERVDMKITRPNPVVEA